VTRVGSGTAKIRDVVYTSSGYESRCSTAHSARRAIGCGRCWARSSSRITEPRSKNVPNTATVAIVASSPKCPSTRSGPGTRIHAPASKMKLMKRYSASSTVPAISQYTPTQGGADRSATFPTVMIVNNRNAKAYACWQP
jgi:hypothetical protein